MRPIDDRLGLAVLRAPLSPRTLVTYARDHVMVRTPSRPGFRDGNVVDLLAPPAPDELATWVGRFRDTVGQLGATCVRLRWEEACSDEAAGDAAGAEELLEAAGQLGLEVTPTVVHLLERPGDVPDPPARIDALEPPAGDLGDAVDRQWHGSGVLYRYASEEPGPEGWRDWDERHVAWLVDVQRELARGGRARVWLATRHGAPVGRVTVTHDLQGLAAVDDLVVHPVHRGAGIGGALLHRSFTEYLDAEPSGRVGAAVPVGSRADRLCRRQGFRPHATVWTAEG